MRHARLSSRTGEENIRVHLTGVSRDGCLFWDGCYRGYHQGV